MSAGRFPITTEGKLKEAEELFDLMKLRQWPHAQNDVPVQKEREGDVKNVIFNTINEIPTW